MKPLSPLDARLVETSYQAVVSPINGVASYRLRAQLEEASPHARIGLRGTAKLYGGWVVFGYYVSAGRWPVCVSGPAGERCRLADAAA